MSFFQNILANTKLTTEEFVITKLSKTYLEQPITQENKEIEFSKL